MKIKQIMPAENYWAKTPDDLSPGSYCYSKILAFALIYDSSISEKEDRYRVEPMSQYGDYVFYVEPGSTDGIQIIFSTIELSETIF